MRKNFVEDKKMMPKTLPRGALKPKKKVESIARSPSTSTRTHDPEGIIAPVKLKPRTVVALELIKKPAAAAAPPPAFNIVTLSKLNWNPPISS